MSLRVTLKRGIQKIVPCFLREAIFRLGMAIGGDFAPGFAFRNYPEFSWLDHSLLALKKLGFAPRMIVDVGAYEGNWTKMVYEIYPEAQFLMVEPQESKKTILQGVVQQLAPRVSLVSSLLGGEDQKSISFYPSETGSSVLPEIHSAGVPSQTLQMRTLASILNEKGFPVPDFIKLDVQGYELEVLKGCKDLLKTASVVLLEVAVQPCNQGAPSFNEVLDYMNEHDFIPFDFGTFFRSANDSRLRQVDLIFVRKDSNLHDRA
ncbi:MAG: FkbM family methyltransferase [Verrucomicrobiota bacterium]